MARDHFHAMSAARCLLAGLALTLTLAPDPVAAGPPLTAEQQSALVQSGIVGDDVVVALSLSVGERVRVIVAFSPVETSSRFGGGGQAMTRRASIAAARGRILGRLSRGGFALIHEFGSVPGFAGWIDSSGLMSLVADPLVRRIDLDTGGHGALGVAIPLVGLDQVHVMGATGDGVTVALIDSGADLDHPDLVDAIVGERCYCTGCCPDGSSDQEGAGSAEDDHGHGTNIAGIITSNGGVAPLGGAPDANIVLVKVLDQNNLFCCSSDVIRGLVWILDERPDVDIVNMSLGTNALYRFECDGVDDDGVFHNGRFHGVDEVDVFHDDYDDAELVLYSEAIGSLRSRGTLVMVATRNDGKDDLISAPACIANAFAVAASDDNDLIPAFSNSNAQTDLFAPGVGIQSTGQAGVSVLTGTSQATALTSACAAALLDAFPSALPEEIEQALVHSPIELDRGPLSFPRLDCADALAVPEPKGSGLLAAALATLGVLARRNNRRAAGAISL